MQRTVLTAYEIDDRRNQYQQCQIDGKPFTLLAGEHQCKRCKLAVCKQCSEFKMIVLGYDTKSEHRVCRNCHAEVEQIKNYVSNNGISFGQDSRVARNWRDLLEIKLGLEGLSQALNEALELTQGGEAALQQYQFYLKCSDQALKSMPASYNYSLREFVHLATIGHSEAQIRKSVDTIVKCVLVTKKSFGYVPELLQLVLFFVCIASEPLAFQLVSKVIDTIIPAELYPNFIRENQVALVAQGKRMTEIMENSLKIQNTDIQMLLKFLQSRFLPITHSLGLNFFNFEIFSQLFDTLVKKKNFQFFEFAICIALQNQVKVFQQSKGNDKLVEVEVLRKQTVSNLFQQINALNAQGLFKNTKNREILKTMKDEKNKTVKESDLYKELLEQNTTLQQQTQKAQSDLASNLVTLQSLQRIITEKDEQISLLRQTQKDQESKYQQLELKFSYDRSTELEREIASLKRQLAERDAQTQKLIQEARDADDKTRATELQLELLRANGSGGVDGAAGAAVSNSALENLKAQITKANKERADLLLENRKIQIQSESDKKNLEALREASKNAQDKAARETAQAEQLIQRKDDEIQQLRAQVKQAEYDKKELNREFEAFEIRKKQFLVDAETFAHAYNLLMQDDIEIEHFRNLVNDLQEIVTLQPNDDLKNKLDHVFDRIKQVYYESQFRSTDCVVKRQLIVTLHASLDDSIKAKEMVDKQVVSMSDTILAKNEQIQQLEGQLKQLQKRIEILQQPAGQVEKKK